MPGGHDSAVPPPGIARLLTVKFLPPTLTVIGP